MAEVVPTAAPIPSPIAAPVMSNVEVKEPELTINTVPADQVTPKLKIHVPEDPMDQLLCEGCQ